MANDVQDVTMKIKPEIDTSDINHDMKKVADTTKGSLEQSISKFDKQLHKSLSSLSEAMTDMKGDGSNDMFTQANIALEHMQNMLREIKNMDAVDSVDAKVYVLGQQVMHTAEAIGQLHKRLEDVKQTAEVTNLFESQYGDVQNAENELKKLQTTAQQLRDTLQTSGVQAGPVNLNAMEEAYHRMEVLRTAIQSTKDDISAMNERADKGTEEWKDEMEVLETVLTRLTSKLGNASRQFYSMGRKAGFGNTKSEILDMYNLAQQSKNAERDIKGLTASIEKYKMASANASNAMSDMARLSGIFEHQKQQMQEMAGETQEVANAMRHVDNSAKQAAQSVSKLRNFIWSISRFLGSVYTVGLDIARLPKQVARVYNTVWGYVKKLVGVFKQLRTAMKGTTDDHKKSWKQMLRDILRYSFGIRSLFMLFRRLRRYIKEAFEAMAEQIPEVNALLNELKASLGMLKGSLATAFEPILSAVAPALLRLIDLLARAITYIGMFFAAFTGRGYVYKATKAIQGMAGAAKELNKQLQGFDELNNLTTNKDSGSGSGPLAIFEKMDVPDWIKNLVATIKKIINAILAPIKAAWDKMKDYVIKSWSYAMKEIGKLFVAVFRDFLIAWSRYGQPIFETIFKIVGHIGQILGNIAGKIREAWNYNQTGLKIWESILRIILLVVNGVERMTDSFRLWTTKLNLKPLFESIRKWLESVEPVMENLMHILEDIWNHVFLPILDWTFNSTKERKSGIARLLDILTKFNTKVDWKKLRTELDRLWTSLARFGEKVGDGLLDFIERLSNRLANWINDGGLERTLDAIVSFVDGFDSKSFADDLERLFNMVQNVAGSIKDVFSYLIDHKDTILTILEVLSEHVTELAITGVVGKLAIDIARLAANFWLMIQAGKAAHTMKKAGGLIPWIKSLLGIESATASTSEVAAVATPLSAKVIAIVRGAWLATAGLIQTHPELLAAGIEKLGQALFGTTNIWEIIGPDAELMLKTLRYDLDWFMAQVVKFILFPFYSVPALLEAAFNKDISFDEALNAYWKKIDDTFNVDAHKDELDRLVDKQYAMGEEIARSIQSGLDAGLNAGMSAAQVANTSISGQVEATGEKLINDQKITVTYTNAGETFGTNATQGFTDSFITDADWATIEAEIDKHFSNLNIPEYSESDWSPVFENAPNALSDNMVIANTIWDNSLREMITSALSDYFTVDNCTVITQPLITSFRTAFDSIVIVANSRMRELFNIVSSWINAMASQINRLGEAMSDMADIAQNLNNLGNMSITSGMIKGKIPHLATGAVIPPNREFLAVLGDQKRGTNIESPLSTMVEAFNMANKGGNEQELALLQEQNELLRQLLQKELTIGDNDIFKSVRRSNKQFTAQNGYSAFA